MSGLPATSEHHDATIFPSSVPLHSAALPPFFPPPNRDAVSISTEVIAHLRARGEAPWREGRAERGRYLHVAGASVRRERGCELRTPPLPLPPHPNPPSQTIYGADWRNGRRRTDCDLARIVESSGRAKELRSRGTGMKSERGRKRGKRGKRRGRCIRLRGRKGSEGNIGRTAYCVVKSVEGSRSSHCKSTKGTGPTTKRNRTCTGPEINPCKWFGEICSCCC